MPAILAYTCTAISYLVIRLMIHWLPLERPAVPSRVQVRLASTRNADLRHHFEYRICSIVAKSPRALSGAAFSSLPKHYLPRIVSMYAKTDG
jgi:hypothetical protein